MRLYYVAEIIPDSLKERNGKNVLTAHLIRVRSCRISKKKVVAVYVPILFGKLAPIRCMLLLNITINTQITNY